MELHVVWIHVLLRHRRLYVILRRSENAHNDWTTGRSIDMTAPETSHMQSHRQKSRCSNPPKKQMSPRCRIGKDSGSHRASPQPAVDRTGSGVGFFISVSGAKSGCRARTGPKTRARPSTAGTPLLAESFGGATSEADAGGGERGW